MVFLLGKMLFQILEVSVNSDLNCADAANFAAADWLPHGGIGAERYFM